jgi:hypothetical protein
MNLPKNIKTIQDVEAYADFFVNELHVNFHSDTPFSDYIRSDNGESSFTPEEISIYDHLMDQCFDVCEKEGVDIYKGKGIRYLWRMRALNTKD